MYNLTKYINIIGCVYCTLGGKIMSTSHHKVYAKHLPTSNCHFKIKLHKQLSHNNSLEVWFTLQKIIDYMS